jgi:hypothetical protein
VKVFVRVRPALCDETVSQSFTCSEEGRCIDYKRNARESVAVKVPKGVFALHAVVVLYY